MALNTLQVTLGAAKTPISATSLVVRQVTFQNNAAAVMRLGDTNVSSTKGHALQPATAPAQANSVTWGELTSYCVDLKDVYVIGTNTQLLDVTYID